MSQRVGFAVLGDGTSDQSLLPIVRWCVQRAFPELTIWTHFDLHRGDVSQAAKQISDRLGPDIFVIHRDAEKISLEERRQQIGERRSFVRLVPVRMTEAWLLTDEQAIRRASGNPNGKSSLSLPAVKRIESVPDPKKVLEDALILASGVTTARKRRRFQQDLAATKRRVSELTEDFSALRELTAYRAFESELIRQVRSLDRAKPS